MLKTINKDQNDIKPLTEYIYTDKKNLQKGTCVCLELQLTLQVHIFKQ